MGSVPEPGRRRLDGTVFAKKSSVILTVELFTPFGSPMDSGQVLQALKRLQTGNDIDAVRSAILELSGPSGPVKSYSVSFNAITRTVSAFLEMRSPMLDSEVRELGACGFGNNVCIEFGLRADSAPPA